MVGWLVGRFVASVDNTSSVARLGLQAIGLHPYNLQRASVIECRS